MSVTNYSLLQCRHAAVFREIVAILKGDPTLDRVVKIWKTWSGVKSENDKIPIAFNLLPWVKLTPTIGPQTWVTNREQESDLNIRVEVGMPGTNVDDVLNIWDAFRRALFPVVNDPTGTAMRQRLKDVGAHSGVVTLTQNAFDPGPDEQTSEMLVGVGVITLKVRVDT